MSPDPDLAAVDKAQAHPGSIRDRLRARIAAAKQAHAEHVVLRPERNPGWAVTYRPLATAAEMTAIAKAAKGGTDDLASNRLVLARCCVAITVDGVALNADLEPAVEGDPPLTFASRALWEDLGVNRAVDAVTAVYRGFVDDGPGDGDITATALDLARRGGLVDHPGVLEDTPDPTTAR